MGQTVFTSSNASWPTPVDWNASANYIEGIAGGAGTVALVGAAGGTGAGQGGFITVTGGNATTSGGAGGGFLVTAGNGSGAGNPGRASLAAVGAGRRSAAPRVPGCTRRAPWRSPWRRWRTRGT